MKRVKQGRTGNMERYEDSSDSDSACDVFDVKNVPSLLSSYDESINVESDVFSMTSLGAFMFLSQNESRTCYGLDAGKEGGKSMDRTRLSLAYERLHTIPKLLVQELAPYITILDISNNEFDNLDFLSEFKQLTSLICDHNNITSATVLPHIPKLELLWLNHCKINELYPWARKLQQACPDLKYLSLMGNGAAPSYLNGGNFYEYLQYRLFMISLFPKLVHLDDRAVTVDQRDEAKRLYKKPLLEKIVANSSAIIPACIRNVSEKVSDILTPLPSFVAQEKNIIV